MTETQAMPVSEVLGTKLTNDRNNVLVGLKQPSNQEFALAIPNEQLGQFIAALIDATANFPLPKGSGEKAVQMLQPNWFEFWRIGDSTDYLFSLYMPSGGHISFRVPQAMAERLAETLAVLFPQSATQPGPDIPRQ
jgi:hypothetical protein